MAIFLGLYFVVELYMSTKPLTECYLKFTMIDSANLRVVLCSAYDDDGSNALDRGGGGVGPRGKGG